MVLTVLQLSRTMPRTDSVDAVEAVQLRIQAENELLKSELETLPTSELRQRVEHQAKMCKKADGFANGAGCAAFLTRIKPYRESSPNSLSLKDRLDAVEALVELHNYQLSAQTGKAYGVKGRAVHRAGAVESARTVAKVLRTMEG